MFKNKTGCGETVIGFEKFQHVPENLKSMQICRTGCLPLNIEDPKLSPLDDLVALHE